MAPEIKICGLSRPEDIDAVNEYGADYAGFVFYEKSRRHVTFRKAGELMALLDRNIKSVAVCVSPSAEDLKKISRLGADIIQIHGRFPGRDITDGLDLPKLWRAVNIKDGMKSELFADDPLISGYVADGADYGAGKTFGWGDGCQRREEFIPPGKTFILAGGLNAGNVRTGIEIFSPDIVDVSSGVEENGFKSRRLIGEFIGKVREI